MWGGGGRGEMLKRVEVEGVKWDGGGGGGSEVGWWWGWRE